MEFKSKLCSVRAVGEKSDEQLSTIENITKFCNSREEILNFYNDYFKMVHKATYDIKNGKGLKILTSKEVLQRLPIALAQVKAGNTSENLLNEIHQIIYSLHQTKEITKKVCNRIMNSITL